MKPIAIARIDLARDAGSVSGANPRMTIPAMQATSTTTAAGPAKLLDVELFSLTFPSLHLTLGRHDVANLNRPHRGLDRFLGRSPEPQVFAQINAAQLVTPVGDSYCVRLSLCRCSRPLEVIAY